VSADSWRDPTADTETTTDLSELKTLSRQQLERVAFHPIALLINTYRPFLKLDEKWQQLGPGV
jgi:hypothetical protein